MLQNRDFRLAGLQKSFLQISASEEYYKGDLHNLYNNTLYNYLFAFKSIFSSKQSIAT